MCKITIKFSFLQFFVRFLRKMTLFGMKKAALVRQPKSFCLHHVI